MEFSVLFFSLFFFNSKAQGKQKGRHGRGCFLKHGLSKLSFHLRGRRYRVPIFPRGWKSSFKKHGTGNQTISVSQSILQNNQEQVTNQDGFELWNYRMRAGLSILSLICQSFRQGLAQVWGFKKIAGLDPVCHWNEMTHWLLLAKRLRSPSEPSMWKNKRRPDSWF